MTYQGMGLFVWFCGLLRLSGFGFFAAEGEGHLPNELVGVVFSGMVQDPSETAALIFGQRVHCYQTHRPVGIAEVL